MRMRHPIRIQDFGDVRGYGFVFVEKTVLIHDLAATGKIDGLADEALRQIEDKGHAKPFVSDRHTDFKIGVKFSSETCSVYEWKEA